MRCTSRLSLGLILVGMAALPATSPANDDPVSLSETDHYNQGVALYRAEQFQESADAFRMAAAASDPWLAARARFNLGNADYARAVASIDSQDPNAVPNAIESLRSAIDSYRSALRIAPKDDDARFNLELANKWMRQLEQQQQAQQEQQQQSSPSQNEQPGEQANDEQNESNPGENQEGEAENEASQQNQQASEGPKDSSEPQDQEQDQSDGSDAETQDQASGDPAGQDKPNESQPPADGSGDDQQEDEGMSGQDPAEPNEPQQTPDGELTATNAMETDQHAAEESEGPSDQPLQMTQEEARKMLQAIRDRDMLRRLRRQAAQRTRQIPVERDW